MKTPSSPWARGALEFLASKVRSQYVDDVTPEMLQPGAVITSTSLACEEAILLLARELGLSEPI